jgi:hypothetical protein
MPDKKNADHPRDDQPATPKRPPKTPAHDYASLPQKPIKLKSDVDLPPALKRPGGKSPAKKRATPPVAKKKSSKKTRAKSAQAEMALSLQALEIATAAAKSQGLPVNAWIEKVITEQSQSADAEPAEQLEAIRQTLQQIDERLWRLENRKGFWRRFWEQYVEPYQK